MQIFFLYSYQHKLKIKIKLNRVLHNTLKGLKELLNLNVRVRRVVLENYLVKIIILKITLIIK